MLNNVVLVGRLTKDPEVVEVEKGYKRTFIVVAVPRPYKNAKGEYETDFVKCILWNAVAEHTCEYCKKGDVIGVKGRIETSSYTKDNEVKYETEVVAERITFLSSKKVEEIEEEE